MIAPPCIRRLTSTLLAFAAASAFSSPTCLIAANYVIAISIDGMGSNQLSPLLEDNRLPNIARLVAEGAGTLNARTDADYAVTLPNHLDMVTGRGVDGTTGHNWAANSWSRGTLASNKRSYVASMFDVAHDNGLTTGMWAGKSKFRLITDSYDAAGGAIDATGTDDGRNKLDTSYVVDRVSANVLTTNFIGTMTAAALNLSFVHYQDPDAAGHSGGWGSRGYNATLEAIDVEIGRILSFIEQDPRLNGNTAILLTADHGGSGRSHGDMNNADDYTIPFLAWGAGVGTGDLYQLNPLARTSPLTTGEPPETLLFPLPTSRSAMAISETWPSTCSASGRFPDRRSIHSRI